MIFFDLDGTLLDFNDSEYYGIKDIYNDYAEFSGWDLDNLYLFWRRISDRYYDEFLRGEISFEEQRIERIIELFYSVKIRLSHNEAKELFYKYIQKQEYRWKAYEDVAQCLVDLSGFKLGIISNGDKEMQISKLKKLGIEKYFTTVVTSSEIGIAKPDNRIFKIACEKAGVEIKNSCYIGDSIKYDMLPCIEIGMHPIWINRKKEELKHHGVTMIYSLKEIKHILGKYSFLS